jgi:hypothetical protein
MEMDDDPNSGTHRNDPKRNKDINQGKEQEEAL